MKKIILYFGILASIMLGTISVAKADPHTFYVKITLTDTCSPGNYHGYYCVRIKLMYRTTVICTKTCCTVTAGPGCYAFSCDFDPLAADYNYGVAFVDAARVGGSCYTTNGTNSGNVFDWPEMSDNTCAYPWVTATL